MKINQTNVMYRRLGIVLLCLSLLLSTGGCASTKTNKSAVSGAYPEYGDYRDIPGVTQEEIDRIETLKATRTSLIYGMCPSTETFYDEHGNIGGYTALFCEWLTDLFGIQFIPEIVEWDDLQSQMANGTIDFTGDMTSTPERLKIYRMTSAIAERSINTFRMQDSEKLGKLAKERNPRFAFLAGTNTRALVEAVAEYGFETVYVNNYDEVIDKLRNREADVFLIDSPAEEAFNAYGGVVSEKFFPLIYTPVSLATEDSELDPIIDVLQKYLDDGAIFHLIKLYNEGHQEYLKHKLFLNLTAEEMTYIAEHVRNDTPIPVAMEFDVYPTIFFNKQENEWQGIAHDVMEEITTLTGLRFEVVNTPEDSWHLLIDMLENGEVAMTTQLLYSKERDGRFIWTDKPYSEDKYALLSTVEHEDINVNQVLYSKVGLVYESAYADVFNAWFPEHPNTVVYMNMDDAFAALEKGEVDLLMTAKNLLLRATNYMEWTGFKANLVFDYNYGSSFGFNKDETVLCSIISKAQGLVDTEAITNRWTSKVFDYNSKMLREIIPYMTVFSLLLLVALLVVIYLFNKNRKISKNLEGLVEERTQELALKTATLLTVFESIPDLVYCKDLNSNFTQFNNSFREHFDCTDDIIGKNDETGLGLPPDIARAYTDTDREIINGGKSATVEEVIPSADGTFPLFETIRTPLIQDGEIIGIVCISRDITQRKVVEEELESASRAKGDFLSRMSHEIRTPLNAIIGMNNIALHSNDLEKTHQCNEKIDDASKHLLGVINDILDMSKIEADKFELSYSEFDFEKILMSIINVIIFRAEEKNQELVVNLGDDVPTVIFGDELRLSQVITNLLSNAVKFTPENGLIILNVNKIDEDGDDVILQIEVIDNGIGISEEQQARLFTSFEQADGSISRKFGGTGLGLAISKRIVELMGGEIWIESELDVGSKFAFTMKVMQYGVKSHAKVSTKVDKSNIRILAVDDSADALSHFSQVMVSHNLQSDVADSGAKALEMIEQSKDRPYNIFFVDWKMTGMDGIELTRKIKEITGENSVVFMTSVSAWNAIEEEAFSAGVRSFIPKPLFPSSIIDAVNECLGVESAKAELHAEAAEAIVDFSSHSILVAEDIEINQEIIKAVLEETGIAIDFAYNGKEAVALFSENMDKYGLIFMDIQMPEMDGYSATRCIRALEMQQAQDIPIIAMTANVFKEDIENCIQAGMNSHIGKPIDTNELLQLLRQYLD